MAIAMRFFYKVFTKCLLNVIQSNDFLKFWRNRLSHERQHLAIWVKFMRPEDVRKSSMVSMMNVRKDLLKFAMLDRASSISSASWVRGLIIIGLNWCVATLI